VVEIWRQIEDDLHLFERNQFHALAAIVVIRGNPLGVRLPELVIAILFFEPRSGCVDRRDPMRLFVLGFVHSGKPVCKVTILGKRQRRRGTENIAAITNLLYSSRLQQRVTAPTVKRIEQTINLI